MFQGVVMCVCVATQLDSLFRFLRLYCSAQEVIDSSTQRNGLDQWFSKRTSVNLSTIRLKHRAGRKRAR